MRKIRERLAIEMKTLRGANLTAVLATIIPIVRGWANYYRSVVSSEAFRSLDMHMWRLTYKWARHGHRSKPISWIIARYYGKFNKSRNDNWVFGNRVSGTHLPKFAWTKIVRHTMVRGTSSPDDPTLALYWAERRRKKPIPQMDRSTMSSLRSQNGKCSLCESSLLLADEQPQSPREWEQWLCATRKAIGRHAIVKQEHAKPNTINYRLVHADCYQRHIAGSNGTAFPQHAIEPLGLA